jgi:ligand-binding sensor domain-containing protein
VAQTPDGFLWLAADEGLIGFDGAEFFVPDEFKQTPYYKRWAQCLWVDPGGSLWIGGLGRVWCRTRKGTFECYDEKSGLPARWSIQAVATDSEGTLWAAPVFHGLFRKNGDRFIEYTAVPELRQEQVYQICPAKSGDLWVSASEGLYRINKSGAQLLDAKNGLPAKLVTALAMDPVGRLWVGTSEGLAYLNQDRFYPVELPGSGKAEVSALFTDSHGMLWIGSSKGEIWGCRRTQRVRLQKRSSGHFLQSPNLAGPTGSWPSARTEMAISGPVRGPACSEFQILGLRFTTQNAVCPATLLTQFFCLDPGKSV